MVYYKYGSPEVLHPEEVATPVPGAGDVLVKVSTAAVNSWDQDLLRGKPFITRLIGGGIFKPRKAILGCDVAGTVVALGAKADRFKVGDAVFGDISECGWGGFAEYVSVPENVLTPKPESLGFQQAAALPQAAVMAWQGIHDYGNVLPGQQVLINGAGGGVGSFAIQMAKLKGARVTGVDSGHKLSSMRALGADEVIDYTREDFTKNEQHYDLILDTVGHHSLFDYRRALCPAGKYLMIGGQTALILQAVFLGPLLSLFGKVKMGILAHRPNKNLATIAQMVVAGKLEVNIDRTFTLDQLAEAFEYFKANTFKGKVVISI
jgi:NADPH:quinone reductase-like Zn-dependent oxidoreductase